MIDMSTNNTIWKDDPNGISHDKYLMIKVETLEAKVAVLETKLAAVYKAAGLK